MSVQYHSQNNKTKVTLPSEKNSLVILSMSCKASLIQGGRQRRTMDLYDTAALGFVLPGCSLCGRRYIFLLALFFLSILLSPTPSLNPSSIHLPTHSHHPTQTQTCASPPSLSTAAAAPTSARRSRTARTLQILRPQRLLIHRQLMHPPLPYPSEGGTSLA